MITECQEARNDNIYIDTIQTNPSLDAYEPRYQQSGTYVDARGENIVDDACKYELNVVKALIPSVSIPISYILPRLTSGDTSADRFDKTIFEFKIEYKGVEYKQPVIWQTSVDTTLYKTPYKIYQTVPAEIVDDRTFHNKFASYYSLFNVDQLTNGFNRALKTLNDSLPTPLSNYPCFTFNSSVGAWLLHCPPEYILDSTNPTVNDIKIYTNKQLTLLFGRAFKYIYGIYSSQTESETFSQINTDIYLRADLKDFDVSQFQAPYNNNVYTFNRNVPNLLNLRKWGGINRIEIYSNIPLVKGRYNKPQDRKTGDFETNESTQDSLLDILYLDSSKLDYQPGNFEARGYPLWQSISNSGALNKISYTMYTVDIYGNRRLIRVPTGSSMTLILQLRKVID
jgi:hypothetical protein